MSNPNWLAISLAIAFEVGAAASLASIITLEKMNKGIVWGLFILLTAMQAMGNTYYTYVHLKDFQGWIELFGLAEEELIYQKRVLSIVSGAILPIVALGFIKSLVDYIRPHGEFDESDKLIESPEPIVDEPIEEVQPIVEEPVDIIETTTTATTEVPQSTTTVPAVKDAQPPKVDNNRKLSDDEAIARGFTLGGNKVTFTDVP